MVEKVARISVSVPVELLGEFDRLITRLKYKRSRAVQEAIRMFIDEHVWRHREDEHVYGTINILYDHEARGLEEALTDIQHAYMDIISSALHIHIDERNCILVIAVRGGSSRVRSLIDELSGKKGIKRIKAITFTA